MDKKKLIIAAVALAVIILGVLVSTKSRESKYKKYVMEETEAELTNIRERLLTQDENRWIDVEESEGVYQIKAEREAKVELPETEFLIRETVKGKDSETIVYRDDEGNERERVEISYYDAPKLAILIDDVGMSMSAAEYFGRIEEPMTFATIPFLPKSREGTEKLREYGFEVILHMPMAGSSDSLNKRTQGILLPSMSRNEVYDNFDRALEDVGQVDGFNNHMGSRFTSDDKKMRELLGYAKRKNLYFIDSNTAVKNLGYPISKELGVPTYYCSHFLDNSRDMEDMKSEIRTAVGMAEKNQKALVIGHYHKGMALAIEEMLPYIENSGVKLVFASDLLEKNQ